jgi:hypothetical protein
LIVAPRNSRLRARADALDLGLVERPPSPDQDLGAVAPVDEQLGHLMPSASWTTIHSSPPLLFRVAGL